MTFKKARTVFIKDRQHDMNLQAHFITDFVANEKYGYKLVITASTLYRIMLNGKFVHYGPARAPHGYARIDEINLSKYIINGHNILIVEVAGYNIGTYYTIKHPSFIQMEIIKDDNEVIACSGDEPQSVSGYVLNERVQKVIRYSYQRNFSEIYHMKHQNIYKNECELEVVTLSLDYLRREVPIPNYQIKKYKDIVENGTISIINKKQNEFIKARHIDDISNIFEGFNHDEVLEHPFEDMQKCIFKKENLVDCCKLAKKEPLLLHEKEYVLFSMDINNVGFIMASIQALQNSEVYFFFDEKLLNGMIDINSMSCANVVKYSLKESDTPYQLESFESYGFKYIMFIVLKGSVLLEFKGIREYSYSDFNNTTFTCSDNSINQLYKASVETYRLNTLDVFMDCPTRERAGWLCDSYFTSQSEQLFSKKLVVEKVMLENFVLAKWFPDLPKGMLPMCYPADHKKQTFIPQWALWYVIELEGYFNRNLAVDHMMFKKLCYDLLDYFKPFENKDGLLEKLEKWNFIEWSDANKYMQDVHYPTNMLYARVLYLIGSWYQDAKLIDQSKHIKSEIIKQSFNGTYFLDHAIRQEDGSLVVSAHQSEVCQYFAIFFNIIDLHDHKYEKLKHLVLQVFGPSRKKLNIRPEIVFANAFIGNYLRMDILYRYGYYNKVMEEIKEYFSKMATITGTLWENDSLETGSLNHGFASYIGVIIVKIVLGLKNVDVSSKTITFNFSYQKLEASGVIGTALGDVEIKRKFVNDKLITSYEVKNGVVVIVE